jgi:tyrosyl-tRNA synthetase
MPSYHKLLLGWGPAQLARLDEDMKTRPMDVKKALAREIVTIFHSADDAVRAEEHFNTVFARKEIPDDIPVKTIDGEIGVVDLIAEQGLVSSKSQGRRMIQQGAVRIEGEKVDDIAHVIVLDAGQEVVVKVGKRQFLRVVRP